MRKIVYIILICLMCFSTASLAVEDTNSIEQAVENSTENSLATNLQNQQKEVQEQIEQANEELSNLQLDITENLEQVQKLDNKIQTAEAELKEASEKALEIHEKVSKIEEEYKIEKQKYDTQKQILEQRVVALYEAGETKFLDVLLNSQSVSEFLSTYYIISEIAESDSEILDAIAVRKKNIEIAETKLNKEKEELAVIVEKETRTSKVLQTTKDLRELYISKLSEQEKETQAKLDEYNKVLEDVNNQLVELAKQGIETEYIGGELAWPVPGYSKISSSYGMRTHPITKVYKLHTGVDISAPMGANFVSANDGLVVKAEYNSAYGNMVVIDHGGGISTLYAHGSAFLVKPGDYVTRNQPVLKVGSTGYSTGPHAHFEVRKNGVVTNPMPYITNGLIPNSEQDKDDSKEEKVNSEKQNEVNTTN